MKLGKTAWIFLAAGIFVILSASLGMAYSKQTEERSRLYPELASVQLLLAKQLAKYSPEEFSYQQTELESQLARTESQLEDIKARLHHPIESIEVTETLFEVAETYEVEIINVSAENVTSRELDVVTFSVLSLTVKIEGDVPNLIDFVLEMSRKFHTGEVKSVAIVVPEVTGGEEEEKPSANIVLSIHTYEGD